MTSNRPYLIRAFYEWICDNGMTPHLQVDATRDGVQVPRDYVKENGQIILNVSPTAVQGLKMTNQEIEFSARFGGRARQVHLPPSAVIGIFAFENGEGIRLPDEPRDEVGKASSASDEAEQIPSPGGKRPSLKIIK